MAEVTVKLDWIAAQHVEAVEPSKEKKKSSSRRQLEEARARETEVCLCCTCKFVARGKQIEKEMSCFCLVCVCSARADLETIFLTDCISFSRSLRNTAPGLTRRAKIRNRPATS